VRETGRGSVEDGRDLVSVVLLKVGLLRPLPTDREAGPLSLNRQNGNWKTMSAVDRANKSVRDGIKSAEEFIESTKKSLQAEFSKKAPGVEHELDRPVEQAGQALSNALKSVGKNASNEQLELLKGYRKFLQGQIAFVDEKIKAMKKG
jgi:hypothetical protein